MEHTYGTNMQQSVWQRFALFFFSFKPNHHGNSAKGEGRGGDMGVPLSAS